MEAQQGSASKQALKENLDLAKPRNLQLDLAKPTVVQLLDSNHLLNLLSHLDSRIPTHRPPQLLDKQPLNLRLHLDNKVLQLSHKQMQSSVLVNNLVLLLDSQQVHQVLLNLPAHLPLDPQMEMQDLILEQPLL